MASNTKIIELKGTLPGKKVVILAGVHGNEKCGVEAFDELIPNLRIKSGSVLFIYANLEAIRQNKRQIEYNLNRCFLKKQPEAMSNSIEGKTALEIMPYLESADAILDIHASPTPDSPPFAICGERWISDCKIFDVDIVSFNWDPFEPGSTDYYMNLQGKPGFCVECGCMYDKTSKDIAKSAIINFLIFSGSTEGMISSRKDQRVVKITGIYKNKFGTFVKSRDFDDFEKLVGKTLIGKDKNTEVYGNKDQIILFVINQEKIGEECFLTAEEMQPYQ